MRWSDIIFHNSNVLIVKRWHELEYPEQISYLITFMLYSRERHIVEITL